MVNYYKILEVENYADIPLIKEVYKKKIRQYHPDINPSKEAEEISKWLNEAKTCLTDTAKKEAYDHKLKMAYLVEINRLKQKASMPPVLWKRNRKKREEAEKLREKQRFERSNKKFPFFLKIGLLIVGLIIGLQQIHANYFINYDGIEMFYSLFGAVLFLLCLFVLSNLIFTYYWVKSVDQVIRFNYEKWIGRVVVLLFLFGPGTIMAVNEYAKYKELSFGYTYFAAELDAFRKSPGGYIYSYKIEDVKYVKRKRHKDGFFVILGPNKILIKYAIKDPKISQPIIEAY